MDDAFARELERLASDCLEESKRHWVARGARPEAHSDDPAVTVTAVEVTVIDGVGTVHVRFVDDRYPGNASAPAFGCPRSWSTRVRARRCCR